jgi:hypothetical protein
VNEDHDFWYYGSDVEVKLVSNVRKVKIVHFQLLGQIKDSVH